MSKLDLSIIVPMYNEAESVHKLVTEVQKVMNATKLKWELICVDDGSQDGTSWALEKMKAECPELKPVYFRRNYGQTAAMQAGFDVVEGKIVATMDGDLQNDPADIPKLIAHMEETKADIVTGWRQNRWQDSKLIRLLPSRTANWLIAKMTNVHVHDNGCSLKIYRNDLVQHLKMYGEQHRFIPALLSQYGAKIEEVAVSYRDREFGESKYGISRTFRVLVDLITVKFLLQYLHKPMHAFGMLGMSLLAPGVVLGFYLTLLKLAGESIGNRPLLILAVMLMLMGVMMLAMGVLAELIVRIYHEPTGRKLYLTRDINDPVKPKSRPMPKKGDVAAKAVETDKPDEVVEEKKKPKAKAKAPAKKPAAKKATTTTAKKTPAKKSATAKKTTTKKATKA